MKISLGIPCESFARQKKKKKKKKKKKQKTTTDQNVYAAAVIRALRNTFHILQATLILGDIAKAVPLIIFGGAAMLGAILSLILPETLNRKLPDTIEEAQKFDR